MNVLSLNTEAFGGGAAQISLTLSKYYQLRNHTSIFYNAINHLPAQNIFRLDHDYYRNWLFRLLQGLLRVSLDHSIQLFPKLLSFLMLLSEPGRWGRLLRGMEDFDQPMTRKIPELIEPRPDVIHAHNLFGNYFDLRELPRISNRLPFVITLHDMWALTGHCSHPLECERWLDACGKCPHLELPPALSRDGTAANLALKKRVYSQSRLNIATPSRWLMDNVGRSVLGDYVASSRIIPNGIDQSYFQPADKSEVRKHLDIPSSSRVLLFIAAGNRQNPWKDYDTLDKAVEILANWLRPLQLVLLVPGETVEEPNSENLLIRSFPWTNDKAELAKYYQAADLYLHAAHAENFPNVILEALSCGLPVIGTNTGGISEQILEGQTGYVVPKSDPEAMAAKALALLSNPGKLALFSENAAKDAEGKYSLERMGNAYLEWFEELLDVA